MAETIVDKKHFEVIVRGQYHALNAVSGTPTLRTYEEKFILPSQEAALSNICKHLLSPRLKKVHGDFIRFRTHELVSITLKGYTPNQDVLQMELDEMNLAELSDFCILRQLMIDPYKHAAKDIFAIRAMVRQAYTAKRQAVKDNQTSKNAIAEKEADTLRRANDLEPTSKDVKVNINEHKATQGVQAAQPAAEQGAGEVVDPLDAPLPPVEDDPVLE